MFSKNFARGFIYYALKNSSAFHHSLSMHIGITEKGFRSLYFSTSEATLFAIVYSVDAVAMKAGVETPEFLVASHDPQSLFRISAGALLWQRQKLKLKISGGIPHLIPPEPPMASRITPFPNDR